MKLTILFVTSVVLGLVILPACSNDDGEQACSRVESLCSGSSSSDGGADGGVSITTKVTCDGKKLDDASNHADVKSCVDGAKDCNAAINCIAQAKE
jgi:hypothetical protein